MAIQITRAGVGLTVGIIAVAGILLGGLLWVKQSGEQARHQDAIKIAEEMQKEKQKEQPSEQQPEQQPPEQQSEVSGVVPDSDAENNSSPSTNNQLPQTGIEDFMPTIIMALVTFSAVSYVTSRQNNRRHLS